VRVIEDVFVDLWIAFLVLQLASVQVTMFFRILAAEFRHGSLLGS
jgi:hypothetical protein